MSHNTGAQSRHEAGVATGAQTYARWHSMSQHRDAIECKLAPLIADAFGLTPRAITQLVAQGFSTSEISDRLHLGLVEAHTCATGAVINVYRPRSKPTKEED